MTPTLRQRLKAWWIRADYVLTRTPLRPMDGQFQPYNYTLRDRYPWLFRFAAHALQGRNDVNILSFGCSEGDEVFALAEYFPGATIKGIDIDPQNVARCETRASKDLAMRLSFEAAGTTEAEPSDTYDAIFCLSVLCNGDLTNSGVKRCDHVMTFDAFERVVTDLARCLKPGGLLFLHTTNFRFCDAAVAAGFDVVLQAEPSQLASDVLFDRDNRLMKHVRYLDVGFRKRISP
jgi:2-polyprenyl-3-methyl-5-hydroxy-6-metoxy-1,4-benzoquinol methylase